MKRSFKSYCFDRNQIIMIFPLLILLGKIVRFTIMKVLLVESSIGWEFLPRIINDGWYFSIGSLGTDINGSAKYNAIAFFKILNLLLHTESFYVFELAITLISNAILIWLFLKIDRKIYLYDGIFLMLFVIVLNLFDFTLAKEPIQLLYFVLIFMCLMNRKWSNYGKITCTTMILLFCVLTFRSYYIFVIYFMFVTFFILWWIKETKIKNRFRKILVLVLFIAVSFIVLMTTIKILAPSEYTYMLYLRTKANRVGSASQINVLFSASASNTMVYVIDLMILVVRMLCPVELLRLGPKYFPYVIFQLMISDKFINALIVCSKEKMSVEMIALCVYTAFLVGSSTFEPDFGSWVRHEAVVFPVILLMSNLVRTQEIRTSRRYCLNGTTSVRRNNG